MSEKRLTDIPASEVDEVVNDFESEGCTTERIRQDNGLWTVVAQCPVAAGEGTTERRLTDVPDSDVGELISDFESEGCTAEKISQGNGLWTVVATCPN